MEERNCKSFLKKGIARTVNYWIFFKFYEQIWGCLFLFFTILGGLMLERVREFLSNPEYNSILIASWSDLFIVLPTCFITWIFRDAFTYLFHSKIQTIIDPVRFKTEEARKVRSKILCKWILDFFYYLFTSVSLYIILKDTEFLPPALLGSGDETLIQTEEFPVIKHIPYLKEIYCLQLGTHLYSFLHQICVNRNDTKFFEYALHHGMALFLIFFSYITNYVNTGALVLLTHDISDVFLVLGRGYTDFSFKIKRVVNLFYIATLSIWVYTRLYVFPRYIIWTNFLLIDRVQDKYRYLFKYVHIYMCSMLIALFLMHAYWTLFMLKAQFNCFVKNKIKVDYDNAAQYRKEEKKIIGN